MTWLRCGLLLTVILRKRLLEAIVLVVQVLLEVEAPDVCVCLTGVLWCCGLTVRFGWCWCACVVVPCV